MLAVACNSSPVMIPASPKSGQLDQLLPGSRFVFGIIGMERTFLYQQNG